MNLRLRTVIYRNNTEIENVPIFSCEPCQRSELFPAVKPQLTVLIRTLNVQERKRVQFQDYSELANLLYKMTSKENEHVSVDELIEERVNELLDLFLIARSLNDREWMEDVCQRLQQITDNAMATYT